MTVSLFSIVKCQKPFITNFMNAQYLFPDNKLGKWRQKAYFVLTKDSQIQNLQIRLLICMNHF